MVDHTKKTQDTYIYIGQYWWIIVFLLKISILTRLSANSKLFIHNLIIVQSKE